jgi:ribosomal protein L7/L12
MNSQDQMTLSADDITDNVRRTTISWVLSMQKAYGQEMGLKCFDVIRETFGEDLVGSVLFGIMEGRKGDTITIRTTTHNLSRKIEAIKEVRYLSGYGLKEAKDAVEDACYKEVVVPLKPEMLDQENDILLSRSIRTLEEAGVTVF